ncbi:MAG: hypothetical protein H7X79_05970 [Sporomusaceae bacterium]|nr:hypothetical protein [Sporomusaceae bacterium]
MLENLTINFIVDIINTACVMLVVTYLLSHTKLYWDILEKNKDKRNIFYLSLLFTCFSLYASFNNIYIEGAFLGLGHVSPILGGFIGGPWVGLIVGSLAAIDRFLIGGFSVWSAAAAILLAGLFSGLYACYKRQGELIGVAAAISFTVIYELAAGGLILLTAPDFEQALHIESKMRLPFMLGNAAIIALYIFMTKNLFAERKMREELKRLDRLHLVGQMAASISHEIRNPMTTVRGYLQYFIGKEPLKPFASQFSLMIEELDRANRIITEYLSLAKNKSINREIVSMEDIVQDVVYFLKTDAQKAGKSIILKLEEVPSILLDIKEIRQLILNLVLNGLEAMPFGGTITIYTYVKDRNVVLAIQDEGCGIPPGITGQIGIPFITTKESAAGLGLAVCYNIAERHGAKMVFETSDKGTTFYLYTPTEQLKKV